MDVKQIELPLEQTPEFKKCVHELNFFKEFVERFDEDHKKAMVIMMQEIKRKTEKVQNLCIHPSTEDEVFISGHNGDEDWTRRCTVCKKIIKTW